MRHYSLSDTPDESKRAAREVVEKLSQKDIDKSLAIYPAFSDFSVKVREQLVIGNKVISKWIMTALHSGIFMGIAPSGKRISLNGVSVHRIEQNKVIQDTMEIDFNSLISQISPGESPKV